MITMDTSPETAADNTSVAMENNNKQDSEAPPRTILLAVDDSENALTAFNWVMDNVHRKSDSVLVMHCPEQSRVPEMKFKGGNLPNLWELEMLLRDLAQTTEKLEKEYTARLEKREANFRLVVEENSTAGEGIISVILSEHVSAVCLGLHGAGSSSKGSFGSVAEYVLRHSPVPVIAVPPSVMPNGFGRVRKRSRALSFKRERTIDENASF